ncbi:MAG TPA: hypothetical protein VFQ62_01790 [Methylomirabilota bacterium]|nr:hypothetical protein [Methylomirabilota bacterium]
MTKLEGLKCRNCSRRYPVAPIVLYDTLSAHVAITPSLLAFDQALANLTSRTR